MFSTVVDRKDDQLVLSVTTEMQRALHLSQGDKVDVEVTPMHRRTRRHFAPGQLLQEHTEVLSELTVDRSWIDAKPVGREIL